VVASTREPDGEQSVATTAYPLDGGPPLRLCKSDFLGFSYGFRPGRSQHDALDALSYALLKKKVNYILDADIAGFFVGHATRTSSKRCIAQVGGTSAEGSTI
jgi:hypothetical protein